ncbi:MAG: hypothetical protein N2112_04320 [Gemmataceae bacterium]|nr:hypothetical protein [Gemmataceae bacterium]
MRRVCWLLLIVALTVVETGCRRWCRPYRDRYDYYDDDCDDRYRRPPRYADRDRCDDPCEPRRGRFLPNDCR